METPETELDLQPVPTTEFRGAELLAQMKLQGIQTFPWKNRPRPLGWLSREQLLLQPFTASEGV